MAANVTICNDTAERAIFIKHTSAAEFATRNLEERFFHIIIFVNDRNFITCMHQILHHGELSAQFTAGMKNLEIALFETGFLEKCYGNSITKCKHLSGGSGRSIHAIRFRSGRPDSCPLPASATAATTIHIAPANADV